MKIIIINHTFQKPEFYKRWMKLSENHPDLDILLLAPSEWKWGQSPTQTYGRIDKLEGHIVEQDRFRVHLIDIKDESLGEYSSKMLETEIINEKPDITYFIGGHTAYPLMQILKLRKKHKELADMKVVCFSMRGHTPTIDFKKDQKGIRKYINTLGKVVILGPRLLRTNRECDAIFCHYPVAYQAFRKDGYKGPIYIQTQVGVDPDVFYPNPESRAKIREKYNINDAFLFGSASRFQSSKGIDEIIKALPSEGNWKYLLMGWGRDDEVERIKNVIHQRNLEDKVIMTGYIDNWTDMAEHWNALDCALHVPLTTPKWEETFSLALVQAMITGLPVIGSSSGSVPYQIGPDGIIISEGNIDEMNEKMKWVMNNPNEAKIIGEKMRERAMNCFNIYHLNELFYHTIYDIVNDKYDDSKIDMAEFNL